MAWDTADVDEVFADHDAEGPGCALGIVQDGALVYAAGYGRASLEHPVGITPETVFDIGSTSKQFTAAAALILADERIFGLDEPICRYLPALPIDPFGRVTIRQLVHHTSGIPDYLSLMSMSGRPFSNDYEEDELIDLIAGQRGLDFLPGTAFSYSNSGYLLLAELVRVTTGTSLRTVAEERLFAPCGMTSTFFHDDFAEIVPRRASAYTPRAQGLAIDVPLIDVLGDGAVYTTVRDLARWDEQFYTCTIPAGVDFTQRLAVTGSLADGTPLDYAFGLFVDSYRSLERVHHAGAWGGYRAQLARYPEVRTSIIVLANVATAPVSRYADAVADIVLADRLAAAPAQRPAETGTPRSTSFAGHAGTYVDGGHSFALRLDVEDAGVTLVLGANRLTLEPVEDCLLAAGDVDLQVQLLSAGHLELRLPAMAALQMHRLNEPVPAPRELGALAGRYRSDELGADLQLVWRDGTLCRRIRWSSWQALTPLGGRLFHDDGVLLRVEPDEGQPVAVTLGSLRARLQRFERID
ncbi:MAG: beta-lactamase family protein [Actinobacteria bacterium]|nr:beta-lactamase family protein [Actinomycetota bacterium]MCA1721736.1 beta-lactamase family protein [Actinomycetota bacterium]